MRKLLKIMLACGSICALSLAVANLVGFGVAQKPSPTERAAQRAAPPHSGTPIPTATGGVVWTTRNVTSAGTISTNATVSNANGYVLVTNGSPLVVSRRAAPRLLISCDENECHAHSQMSMDDARAMLERVTHRQVVIELVTDQHCQVQRETIKPKPKEDLVASAQ